MSINVGTKLSEEQLGSQSSQDWPENTTVLASSGGIEGSFWLLEIADENSFERLSSHVAKLALKSKTANSFFGSAFLQPAARYLGNGKVQFLCLSEITGDHRELRFFAPVTFEKVGMRRHMVLRIWSHPYAPVSTPIVDETELDRTLTELISCIEAVSDKHFDAILFENLPKHANFARSLHADPRLSERLIRFSASSRGGIIGKEGLDHAVNQVTGKRKQRLRKATERLEALGQLNFSIASYPVAVDHALTQHLELEDKGWKSKKGTSILKDGDALRFVSEAIPQMSLEECCEIHSLKLNDSLIASMILIQKNGFYFPWKIAFYETYAKYSVGNLLLTHVNKHISNDSQFVQLDSLASELNETARRFWPDQLELSSMVIGIGPNASKTALQIANEMQLLSGMKLRLKKWLGRSL